MNLFSDIVAQRLQILVENAIFYKFLEILPPRASASHFVCICVLSLYTLYVSGNLRHEEEGGDGLQLKNGNSGWGTYTLYI